MAVDPELLEILVCPKTKGALELVELPAEVRDSWWRSTASTSATRSRWSSRRSTAPSPQLVYPIVSDIPIMLIDEALPASAIGVAAPLQPRGASARAERRRVLGQRLQLWAVGALAVSNVFMGVSAIAALWDARRNPPARAPCGRWRRLPRSPGRRLPCSSSSSPTAFSYEPRTSVDAPRRGSALAAAGAGARHRSQRVAGARASSAGSWSWWRCSRCSGLVAVPGRRCRRRAPAASAARSRTT